jgi:hypothetical protein
LRRRFNLRLARFLYELKQPLVTAHPNHVARGQLAQQEVGSSKPQRSLLRVAIEDLSDQVSDVGDLVQSLRKIRRYLVVESDRTLSDVGDSRKVVFGQVQERRNLSVIKLAVLREMQVILPRYIAE